MPRLAALLLAAFIAVLAWVSWVWPNAYLVDDSYFYLAVGRNLAAGNGSTFGGVVPTNGYHPLWQWIVAGLCRLIGDHDVAVLRAVVLSNVAMVAGSLLLLWRIAARFMSERLAPVAPLLFTFVATRPAFGLETWLYVLLVVALLERTASGRVTRCDRGWPGHVATGLLAGAIVLARLDGAILVAAWFAFVGVRRLRDEKVRPGLPATALEAGCALALVLPYLFWNKLAFGHFATISAILKVSFPRVTLVGLDNWRFLVLTVPGVILGALLLARPGIWCPWRRAEQDGELLLALRIGAAGVVLHTLVIWFFSAWPPHLPSYWVDAVLLACLLGPGLVASVLRWRPRLELALLVPLYLVPVLWQVASLALVFRIAETNWNAVQALGRWYAEEVPADAVVFQKDHNGEPAFWSRRRFLDGHGLMNNLEYQEAILAGELPAYLHRHEVAYLAWDGLEDLPDAPALLSGEYESVGLPVNSAIGRQWGRAVLTYTYLQREWEQARFRYVRLHGPPWRGPREVVSTFCLWRLPRVSDPAPEDSPEESRTTEPPKPG